MSAGTRPRLYTIAPGAPFLRVLAREILAGFPLARGEAAPPLMTWTVLLPNRRSARLFQEILFEESGRDTLMMPRIRPIGDADEDLLLLGPEAGDLPPAISDTGRLFLLCSLILDWAHEMAGNDLADELRSGSQQVLTLATSLAGLLDEVEEEGLSLDQLPLAFPAELAVHREAILSLLDILRVQLPQRLAAEGLIGQRQRCNRLIRLEAERIAGGQSGPVVAAGSTGTLAATRDLLRAVAHHPQGAVVLPGLQTGSDEEEWEAIGPQHPQYGLKRLIAALAAAPADVVSLGGGAGPRSWLAGEILRPSTTTDRWLTTLSGQDDVLEPATAGLTLIAAPDRHIEARSIALILRRAAGEQRSAALITPDRDIARRVKAELLRWNLAIDDTAGEPLIRQGGAALIDLMLQTVERGFTAASIVSLLQHPDVTLGRDRTTLLALARSLEADVFRAQGVSAGPKGLFSALSRAKADARRNSSSEAGRPGPDWAALEELLAALITALEPAAAATPAPFPTHLARVLAAFRSLAPELDWSVPGNRQLAETLEDIETEAHRFPPGSFAPAAAAIRQRLMAVIERPQASFSSHLAIYGLLEARLMQPDVTILGGLNEGTWPAQPDGGPWINRRMRAEFGLQQPERAIGQTAHDFAQAFCSGEVYLTWSQRIGTAPAIPSRWVLRLGTVLAALGRKSGEQVSGFWPALARALDRSNQFRPTTKPSPRPPVMARPRRISVTQVETLVRDPYALYATEVLQLAPLKPLAAEPDAALRGSLFHRALGAWNQTLGETPGSAYLDRLIAAGEAAFAPFMEDQDIAYFWWPRFLRMARWMAEAEPALRAGVLASHAEISGVLDIDIAGERHRLTGRADRIDILPEGARIIDYKTGKPPSSSQVASGFAPQLTLEAAMLARGAFAAAGRHGTAELLYITSSGGTPPGELKPIDFTRSGREPIQAVAERQFENFKTLLGHYMKAGTPYLPRLALEQEDDDSAFDHLSRYREWSLSGGGTG